MNNTNVRMPAVAGRFYPAEQSKLKSMIKEFLEDVPEQKADGELVGIMSPHAGYVFSGPIAAYSYTLLQGKAFDTVILIGPAHSYPVQTVSVYKEGAYRTPLGDVNIDEELATKIMDENDNIGFMKAAHQSEHCLEVQVPFLQTVLEDFQIVPILISDPRFAEPLADAVWNAVQKSTDKKILVVNSTDLSHYPPYKEAVRSDRAVLAAIESMDTDRVAQTIQDCESGKFRGVQTAACGKAGILATIHYAKKAGAEAKILHYANSGDSPYGEKDGVVGYGAVAYMKRNSSSEHNPGTENEEADMVEEDASIEMGLNEKEKKDLLRLARNTIERKVKGETLPEFHTDSEILKQERGAFVTLEKHGQLRGCIGVFEPHKPLTDVIKDMAISAAFRDPRFPPVKESEVDDLEIEISVLTPLRLIDDVEEIEVGKHGICIERGFNRGVLLPQVATEHNWDRKTFLEQTCWKARLPQDAWKAEETKIYIFSAQIFHEE